MKEKDLSSRILKILGVLFIVLFTIITIIPLYQTIIISIKPVQEFTINPLSFPKEIRLYNYIDAWVDGNLNVLFLNTIIVTFSTVIIVILLASPAGFALAKLNLKGKKAIYNYFILGMIVPIQVIMIPLLKFSGGANLTNTLSMLIIIYVGLWISFPVLMYTGFYKSIPYEIIEAARLDGCNIFSLFTRIIFPMTSSINLTIAIFVGKEPWRDFFVPLIFTTDNSKRTLAMGLFNFQTSYFNDWTVIFAMIVIMSLPLVLFYAFMQKTFIKGIIGGAVKG